MVTLAESNARIRLAAERWRRDGDTGLLLAAMMEGLVLHGGLSGAHDALRTIGSAAAPALLDLWRVFGDSRGLDRVELVRTIGWIDPESAALRSLVADHPDVDVRLQAIRTIRDLGEAARHAAPALVEALADPELLVRSGAALALWNVHGQVDLAFPVLTGEPFDRDLYEGQINELLSLNDVVDLRQYWPETVEAVVTMTHAEPERIADLSGALEDDRVVRRLNACRVVWLAGGDAPRVKAALRRAQPALTNAEARVALLELLALLGPRAADCADLAEGSLTADSEFVRACATQALQRLRSARH